MARAQRDASSLPTPLLCAVPPARGALRVPCVGLPSSFRRRVSGVRATLMTLTHRAAPYARACLFADPVEEAQPQLRQSARLTPGVLLAAEAVCVDAAREPALAAPLLRLADARDDAAAT